MAKKQAAQLAAQLYTLREHLQKPRDIARTLKRVRKIGYENVQVSGVGPIDPLELKKMIDDAGLTVIGAHIGLVQMREDIDEVIDRLHVWASPYVSIPAVPGEDRKTGASWKKLAKECSKFGRTFAKEGIVLNYHNHAFEFHRYKGKTCLEILYDESDPKALQAEIDTCWVARGGGDPAAWCERMKGRLDQVHLKDSVMLNDEPVFAEIGEGNLNWPAILKACKKARTKHYIIEQDLCPVTKNPFKSLEISYKNLRNMGLR